MILENSITWTFGDLDGVLSGVHQIDSSKRTAFQARLKNFHRLHYPMGFSAIKGKAATYSPLQIIDMALAVEMTQLGLPPERAALVLVMNRWPTLMAIQLAARALAAKPEGFDAEAEQVDDPLSMFIYFDPAALNSLTLHLPAKTLPDLDQASNSFFYGGVGIIKENIHKWTTGPVCRISMINITSMIDVVTASPFERGSPDAIAYRLNFFRQLALLLVLNMFY